MEYSYGSEKDICLILILIIIIGSFLFLVFTFNVVMPFIEERNYIKMEMKRSEDEEYYHWKRKLKRLYLSYIPFIGWFFR